MNAHRLQKSLGLLALPLITSGCDSGSPQPDSKPPAKAVQTSSETSPPSSPSPQPPPQSPVITVTEVKGKDGLSEYRDFVAKHSGNVDSMARALREMEPSEENMRRISDILFVFTENPQIALENYRLISDAIPDSVRSVFASHIGRHAARDAAPDDWIKRINSSEASGYYQAIVVSEMFNRMPPSFSVCDWLSRTAASAEMKFAAAATERTLKEALTNSGSLDVIFQNVPEKHRPEAAEMLAGSAVQKVDGKLMDTLMAMQNPAREDCLVAAALHWGDRNLNETLKWIETSPVQTPLKARMVEALLPEIENWDKTAAEVWMKKYSRRSE